MGADPRPVPSRRYGAPPTRCGCARFAADGTLWFQDAQRNGLLGAYAEIAVASTSDPTHLIAARTASRTPRPRAVLPTPAGDRLRGSGTPRLPAVESHGGRPPPGSWGSTGWKSGSEPRAPGQQVVRGQSRRRRLAAVAAQGRRRHRLGQPAGAGSGSGSDPPSSRRRPPARRIHRPARHTWTAAPTVMAGNVRWARAPARRSSQIRREELGLASTRPDSSWRRAPAWRRST